MKIGVVGAAADKFTPESEARARAAIRDILIRRGATCAVSGGCHLGGVDWWANEEAVALGLEFELWAPQNYRWQPDGYKARNMQIAKRSNETYSIVVAAYPLGYAGRTWPACYHCDWRDSPHVKSGGCWTVKYAKKLGKPGGVIVV